jgi:predicted TIM-barrel enzyme
VLAGSGVTAETVTPVLEIADGVIAGSCLRADGRAGGAVDEARVADFVRQARGGSS